MLNVVQIRKYLLQNLLIYIFLYVKNAYPNSNSNNDNKKKHTTTIDLKPLKQVHGKINGRIRIKT